MMLIQVLLQKNYAELDHTADLKLLSLKSAPKVIFVQWDPIHIIPPNNCEPNYIYVWHAICKACKMSK